jgi:RHS repeat-associated protein
MKYEAFGKITWLSVNFSTKNNSDYNWNRVFTGQVLDSETGLMLYRNRYYHVGLGRFITRDPIGYNANAETLYLYVLNSPNQYIDPAGLFSIQDIIAPFNEGSVNSCVTVSLGPFYPFPGHPILTFLSITGSITGCYSEGVCCNNCEIMKYHQLSVSGTLTGRYGTHQPGGPKPKPPKKPKKKPPKKKKGPAPGGWIPPDDRTDIGGGRGMSESNDDCPRSGIDGELSICFSVHMGAGMGVTAGGCISCPLNEGGIQGCLNDISSGIYANTEWGIVGAGAEVSISVAIKVTGLEATGEDCE